jgi:hypothetical protein
MCSALIRVLAPLLAVPFAAHASTAVLSNGDFSSWSGSVPSAWALSGGATATRVEAWSGSAVLLSLTANPDPAASLSQPFSTSVPDRFTAVWEFAQAPAAGERGIGSTLRSSSGPLLNWRVSSAGALQFFDGANWVSVGPAGLVASGPLLSPDTPPAAYRLTIAGSLAARAYSVALTEIASGAELLALDHLAHWQSTPSAGTALVRIHLERGRSTADALFDNISVSAVAPPAPPPLVISTERPSILLSAADFSAWRALATEEPWTSMRAAALARAASLAYDPALGYRLRALRLKEVVNALALAAILDESAAPATHAARFHAQLVLGLDDLLVGRPAGAWDGNTPVGSALFDAILALDIFHPHLTLEQRADLESRLAAWTTRISGWDPSPQAVRALWALYTGDAAAYNSNRAAYLNALFGKFSADGVYVAGTGYAMARFGYYDREQKHLFFELLRRRGEVTASQESRMRALTEWLYGYALAPHAHNHVFGDSAPNRAINGAPDYAFDSPTGVFVAGRFGADAASYAMRQRLAPAPWPGLMPYALATAASDEPPARLAPSRLFTDGGAWFQAEDGERGALSGALWNARIDESHTHKETNALSLVAHGQLLLTNAGYAGYGIGVLGFPWSYIRDRAVSGNTVLLDYPLANPASAPATNDHALKRGAGLLTGFTGREFDYALGDSGSALPNGRHLRHFAFVRPQDSRPGYWLVLDEAAATTATSTAHAAWHPYSTALQAHVPGEHYSALATGWVSPGVALHLHLTTPPSLAQNLPGLVAHFNDASFIGRFLYATYPLSAGSARFGTVLLPVAPGESPPILARESGPAHHATRITWPDGASDLWVLPHDAAAELALGDVTLRAAAAWLRLAPDGSLRNALLVRGRLLRPAPSAPAWLEASAPATVYLGRGYTSLAPGSPAPDLLRELSPPPPRVSLSRAAHHWLVDAEGLDPARQHRFQRSLDLHDWSDLGPAFTARERSLAQDDPGPVPRVFYRVVSP